MLRHKTAIMPNFKVENLPQRN